MSRIAIVGSGISGLSAAYLLSREHEVTLFEANDYLGGHTATVDIELDGREYAIDTGFIVFNDRTYPNFLKLLDLAGVEKQATEMSFSVQHAGSGIEYNGNNIASLFAQRRNLLSLQFYGFLYQILRFNRVSKKTYYRPGEHLTDETLGDFLSRNRFDSFFADHYILPMVAAIWSASINDAREFPLSFFLRFFEHHGLLNIVDRPQWYVVKDGSRSYIPELTKSIKDIRLNTPVQGVLRTAAGVIVETKNEAESFDEIILACHSDQALAMLKDPTDEERAILGGLRYRANDVVLHTDSNMLPRSRGAWASWNFWQSGNPDSPPAVTYNMNILQGIDSEHDFCVTLNRSQDVDESKILRQFTYAHPVYDSGTLAAQQQRFEICGLRHTHYCGAYWYNGFHEDGLKSALDVCNRFGVTL